MELGEYSPLEVKISVVGYGRAEKHQVRRMVRILTGLEQEIETEDVSDALAVAICHATTVGTSGGRREPERRVAGGLPDVAVWADRWSARRRWRVRRERTAAGDLHQDVSRLRSRLRFDLGGPQRHGVL